MIRVRFDRKCRIHKGAEAVSGGAHRYYECVFLDAAGWLVATNGYAISIVPCDINGDGEKLPDTVALSPDIFREACRSALDPSHAHIEVDLEASHAQVTYKAGHKVVTDILENKPIDWRTPAAKVARNLKSYQQAEPCQLNQVAFNPALIAAIQAATNIELPVLFTVKPEGSTSANPGLVVSSNYVRRDKPERYPFGLVMPIYIGPHVQEKAIGLGEMMEIPAHFPDFQTPLE